MKKLLPLLLLILIGCSKEPLNYGLLQERDGVHYRKDTNEIYSGPVFNIKGTSEGYIKKGKWNGEFEFYHSNGQLKEDSTYKNGNVDGLFKSYFENGQLEREITYKDGIPSGPYTSYYENGQLEEEGTYKTNQLYGKRDGPYKEYYDNGQLRKEDRKSVV